MFSSSSLEKTTGGNDLGRHPLWTGFSKNGFSVQWHDFQCESPLDWHFRADSVEICLNLAGRAEFSIGGKRQELPPSSAAFYFSGRERLKAQRLPEERHQFMTVEISRDFLRRRFHPDETGLHPKIQSLLKGKNGRAKIGEVRRLTAEQQRLVPVLRNPPSPAAAHAVWFEGKVLELVAGFFFVPEQELFCERQKRVSQERVQKVIELLRGNLAEPPELLELGRRVGCSPFYLSRTFSEHLGMTIPQHLRQLRMERAAELLRSGKYNVTEAAMEVGYSSVSHFSRAFCQAMGCCPNLYPLLKR